MDGAPSQPRPSLPGHRKCRCPCPCVLRSLQERQQQQPSVGAVGVSRHRMLCLRSRSGIFLRSVSFQSPTRNVSDLADQRIVFLRSQMPTSPPSLRRPNQQPATSTSLSAASTPSSGALPHNSATLVRRLPLLGSSSITPLKSSPPSPPPMDPTSLPLHRHFSPLVALSPP